MPARACVPQGTHVPTESIATEHGALPATGPACAACGSPVAADQRYCLECGERQVPVSEFLRGGAPAHPPEQPPAALLPGPPAEPPRSNLVALLAGVGVLLLAMGVGVLIGRSGSGTARSPATEVVSVAGGATNTTAAAATPSEEAFKSDWPAGKSGWTVELQTLPEGSTAAQVAAAKTAATAKGAKSVGALKAEEFPSVGGSGYVVYSGAYQSRAQAAHAAGSLKKAFPGAKPVDVSNGSGSEPSSSPRIPPSSSGGNKPSVPSSLTKPARLAPKPASHGRKYEEESAKLPEVVETG